MPQCAWCPLQDSDYNQAAEQIQTAYRRAPGGVPRSSHQRRIIYAIGLWLNHTPMSSATLVLGPTVGISMAESSCLRLALGSARR